MAPAEGVFKVHILLCVGGRLLFTVPVLLVSVKRSTTAEQFKQQSKPWPRLRFLKTQNDYKERISNPRWG